LAKDDIQVIIIDDHNFNRCDANCGADWASAEVSNTARQRIKERFGDRVRLDYIDLSQPATNNLTLQWRQRTGSEKLPLPLLTINGEIRISGPFDTRMLLDTIDATIEIMTEGELTR